MTEHATPLSGILNVDKPLGVTSHDVVAQVRRILSVTRVGHAGTLDPLATGVLLVCVGSATRMSEFLMASSKTYVADVRLGRATTTDDAEGTVIRETDTSEVAGESIAAALPAFVGDIEQVPPAFSAIKQGGRKLYEMARKGETIDAPPRPVHIESIRLLSWNAPIAHLEVVCGPGTYIRSLARDLGRALDVGGSLDGLRRTISGRFRAEDGLPSGALKDPVALRDALIPLRIALAGWPEVSLTDAMLADLRMGRRISDGDFSEPGALALGIAPNGDVAALLRATPDGWQPARVLSTE